jgi:hypothetical protein
MSKDITQLAITVGRYEMLVELHEKETKTLLEIAERMEQAKAKAETEADLETEAYLWDLENGAYSDSEDAEQEWFETMEEHQKL